MRPHNHTRTALITAALLIIAITSAAFADVQIDARIQINPVPRDLQVWIWPDRGEGATYFPGETIYMNVEATQDCFLILYNIDTRGNMRILFPYDPWDDNFVRGGEVVTFPRDWDDYEWTVDGPEGVEYVQAIASEFPINPPDWPIYMRSNNRGGAISHDRDLRDFRAGNDRFGYIDIVNRKIIGRYYDYTATDLASFYVQSRSYRPVNVHVGFDPWPDIFYGEIYISWPVGGRIYIDGVYVGIAPLWIPRHYRHGRHVITCYDGRRLLREQTVHYYAKRDYRYRTDAFQRIDVYDRGYVKSARRGGVDVYRQDVRGGKVIVRDRNDNRRGDDRYEKPSTRNRGDDKWNDRDDEDSGYRGRDDEDNGGYKIRGRDDDGRDERTSYTKPAATPKPVVTSKSSKVVTKQTRGMETSAPQSEPRTAIKGVEVKRSSKKVVTKQTRGMETNAPQSEPRTASKGAEVKQSANKVVTKQTRGMETNAAQSEPRTAIKGVKVKQSARVDSPDAAKSVAKVKPQDKSKPAEKAKSVKSSGEKQSKVSGDERSGSAKSKRAPR